MKTRRLRSLHSLSSLALLTLTTSAFAVSHITIQPEHVIAPLGGDALMMFQVEAGYPHSTTIQGITEKCPRAWIPCPPWKALLEDAAQFRNVESISAGPAWFEITGAAGKEKSATFQITIVDQTVNMPVDRGAGGSVSFTARAWNPAKTAAPASAYQWYASDNTPMEDGFYSAIGTVKGSKTAVMTISSLRQLNASVVNSQGFYCKVKGYGPDSLNTALYTVNVFSTAPKVPATGIGSYVGIIAPGQMNSNAGGRLDLTVSATSMSASVKIVGSPAVALKSGPPTVSGNLLNCILSNITVSPPLVVLCQIDATTSRFVGTSVVLKGALNCPITGWRKTPASTVVQGRYNFPLAITQTNPATLPPGRCWGSFTVAAAGTYTMVGRTACDEAFTCSAFVGPDANSANVAMYSEQPSGSTFSGTCLMDVNNGLPNYLKSSTIIWRRPPNLTAIYPAGFNEPTTIDGGKYIPATNMLNSIVTASGASADLTFTCVGLPATYNPNRSLSFNDYTIIGAVTNMPGNGLYGPSLTSLNINTSTGLINPALSKFTLVDYSPQNYSMVMRAVSYSGIAFPTPNVLGGMTVEGYFMLPEIPAALGQPTMKQGGLVLLR